MPKEKTTNRVIAEIKKEVATTTIPQMLKILYMMATATQVLNSTSFERLKGVYAKYGVFPKDNDLLTGLTDYCKFVSMATTQFLHRIEPLIQGSTYDACIELGEGERAGMAAYDSFNASCSEIVRIVLMLVDRASGDANAFDRVVDTLMSLPSKGLLSEDDFNRFKI